MTETTGEVTPAEEDEVAVSDLTVGQRRRLAADLIAPNAALTEFESSFEQVVESPAKGCVEAQSAILIARNSSIEAIFSAHTLNRIQKISEGKSPQGKFTSSAQGAMRSALLFAGAGLDRALKQLVIDAIPDLVEFEQGALERLHKFAEYHLSSKNSDGIDPRSLVKILLGRGQTPKEIIIKSWLRDLTASSAQSSERVTELASALGVTDESIRRRVATSPTKTKLLERAFVARNEIAHELDMVAPKSGTRERFERKQRERKVEDVREFVGEIINIGQLIISNVNDRLSKAPAQRGVTYADLLVKKW